MKRRARWPATLLLWAAGCATAPPPIVGPAAPSYERKVGWILRLENERVLRDPAPATAPAPVASGRRRPAVALPPPPPDLVAMLGDSDARIRRRAAIAIGRVGLAEGVEPLLAVLRDPDPEVRLAACQALGLLGDRRARDALVAALEDGEARVQGRAAEALGRLGDASAAPAIGGMIARHAADPAVTGLAADDPGGSLAPAADAFRLGLYALARLKAWEPLASVVLDAQGAPRFNWWPVAYAVASIGDPRSAPALLSFARGGAANAAGFAARGLGTLKEPRGVDVLLPLLDATAHDRRLVVAAARALGQIGRPEAIEPLRRLLRQPRVEPAVLAEVLSALGALRARAAVEDFIDLAGHPSVVVRGAALAALAAADLETFLTVLSGLDADPAWQVRADLARALGGLPREQALPRLDDLLRDEDQRVVAAALRARAAVKAPDLADRLREHLTKDDVALRATAATLLGELRPAGGDAWARAAWARGRSDASYIARAAALGALARYGLAAARATLEEALSDPDWAVRLRAAELWRQLEPQADVARMRPAPTRVAAEEFDAPALVAPAFSPQVYLETDKGTIQIELDVIDTPLTSANFVALVRKGFFDGLPVHRVVPDFVAQGGDPRGDSEGGPGYTIRDELGGRPYLRGTVGMALDWADTGGSQFFITYGPEPRLDGRYTAFGVVVAGMDVVDRLERWDVIRRARVWDGVQAPR